MQGQPGSSEQIPAGWYPDPNIAGTMRYWDGDGWTDHTASGYDEPGSASAHDPYQHARPTPAFADANRQSLGAIAFALVLVILGQAIGVSFLGIFPIWLAYTALRSREPLGPAAMVVAVGVLVVGLVARGVI